MSEYRSNSCKQCHSDSQRTFNGEVAIHFPGLEGLDKPITFVFPQIVICLGCGFSEFTVPEKEMRLLVQNSSVRPAKGTDSRSVA